LIGDNTIGDHSKAYRLTHRRHLAGVRNFSDCDGCGDGDDGDDDDNVDSRPNDDCDCSGDDDDDNDNDDYCIVLYCIYTFI